jgi:hypothetical protein
MHTPILYSENTTRVYQSRGIQVGEHVARMAELQNVYQNLTDRPDRTKSL